jgi:hypothetical protein
VDKLVLISIILATVFVPASAARLPDARRALRRVIVGLLISNVLYLIGLLYVFPRMR